MKVSAYIPCCNNAATLAPAIASVQKQTLAVAEIFVVDDASADDSVGVAQALGVPVLTHPLNLGRGAVRARALAQARHEMVLSCDAGLALPADFLERAIKYFSHPDVAAVFGRPVQVSLRTAVERWRARHLFKMRSGLRINRQASLATGGVLLSKSWAKRAGNFDATLREGEDADLGARLLALGCDVVLDPALELKALGTNTLTELLERYRRWNASAGPLSAADYLKQIGYSLKVMAAEDLRDSDWSAALISLLCPHYLFWQGRAGGGIKR